MARVYPLHELIEVELLEIQKDRTFHYAVKADDPKLAVGAICVVDFKGELTTAKIVKIEKDHSVIKYARWSLKVIEHIQ
jgi:primosomal protein N'